MPLQKFRQIKRGDGALVGAFIAHVELRVGVAGSEGERVPAESPDGIYGRHEAVLENAGVRTLRTWTRTDV